MTPPPTPDDRFTCPECGATIGSAWDFDNHMVEHRLGIPLSSSESESEDELEFSQNFEKKRGRELRVLCRRIDLKNYRMVPVMSDIGASKDFEINSTNRVRMNLSI